MQRMESDLKTASFPSLRVDPELRQAAQGVLREGESLSSFMEQSIRESIERLQAQVDFNRRGIISRDVARGKSTYDPSDVVIGRLEEMLARARREAMTRG
jgi:hypothetical protein